MDRIDEIDAKILELLQANGRMKRSAVSEEVGLSLPAVSERMRKLQEKGVLQGYHARVSAKRLHIDITAFIRLRVDGSEHYDDVVQKAVDSDEVLEIHSVTGEGSHILKIRTRNTTTLERLLSQIQQWPGVHGTSTSIVLSTFKETQQVPVEPTTLVPENHELD